MKYLLDTHAIIWFSQNSPQLPDKINEIIINPNNTCLISLASIWEMSIKIKIGKMNLIGNLYDFVNELILIDFKFLDIKLEHVVEAGSLFRFHNDPFDRMIITQSLIEKIPIISKDSMFDNYKVNRIW